MTSKTHEILEAITLAGGRIVGKTRLQKAMFILEQAGVGFGFEFSYHHYGPYSEELAWATKDAADEGLIREKEDQAKWGGFYSTFIVQQKCEPANDAATSIRSALLKKIVPADSVVLEIAATAALLKSIGVDDFWEETERLKPLKASHEVISDAKKFWSDLRKIDTPDRLAELG
jgi:uncharacterized protein YwgA